MSFGAFLKASLSSQSIFCPNFQFPGKIYFNNVDLKRLAQLEEDKVWEQDITKNNG